MVMTMAGSYYDLATSMVQTIIVMRLLGVAGWGLWVIGGLFITWFSNSHLGVLQGLSKQLPMALGRREEARAQEIEDVGITTILALGFLAGLALLAYALWWPSREGLVTREVIACAAGCMLCTQISNTYRVVLRAWGTFSVITIASFVFNTAQVILCIAGAAWFGVVGAMLGLLIASLLQLLYLHFASHLKIWVRWNWPSARYLGRTGLPLWGTIFANMALTSISPSLVARFFGAYDTGLFGAAARLASVLNRIPDAAGFVLMPHIWEGYARDGLSALRRHVILPTLASATIMPALCGAIFVMTPYLFTKIVPSFVPGAFAAQILALATVFMGLPLAANGLLVAMNQERIVTFSKLAGTAVAAAGAVWLLHFRLAFTDVAILDRMALFATAGFALSSLLMLIPALGQFFRGWRMVGQLALFHLPLLWAIGALWVAHLVAGRVFSAQIGPSFAGMLLRLTVFLLVYAPVLWYGNREIGLLHRVRGLRSRHPAT
jgi:O-antigen/teichoic acid export membrane protein